MDGPLTQHRRLALLAILAVAGDAGVSRDKLLGLLWPETDEEHARHSLSQTVFLLRRDLGAGEFIRGTSELSIDAEALTSDVGDFEQAVRRADHEAAVGVYDGAFLDGFHLSGAADFAHWVDGERERLTRDWHRALACVANARSARGDHAAAAHAWRRLTMADPYDGGAALSLARALVASNDVAGALAHLCVHAKLVQQDLGIEASPEIRAYLETLRRLPPRSAPEPPRTESPKSAAPSSNPQDAAPMMRSGRTHRGRARRWLGVTAGIALLLGVSAQLVPERLRATTMVLLTRGTASPIPRRIVVSPLENRTGDETLDAFGDYAADWIRVKLVGTGEFEVVDQRTSVATLRVVDAMPGLLRGDPTMALARETRAAVLVSGEYFRTNDSLEVVVSLTDVATGTVSRTIGPMRSSAADQASSAAALAHAVVAAAASQADTGLAGILVAANAPPSYEAYRETRDAWARYYEGDLAGVFAHARRAAALDTNYMAPIAMQAYVRSEMRDWTEVAALVRTLEAHREHLTAGEQSALTLSHAQLDGDIRGQLSAAQNIARATPSAVELQTYVARLAVNADRPSTALAVLDSVEPDRGVMLAAPWYWDWKTAALHERRQHRLELDVARAGMRQFPGHRLAILNVGRALAALGRAEEVQGLVAKLPKRPAPECAKVILDWSRELRAHGQASSARVLAGEALRSLGSDTSPQGLALRAATLAELGRLAEARAVADTVLARHVDEITAHGLSGAIAAMSGETARAAADDSALATSRIPYPIGRHTMWRARIAALLGNRDHAIELAELAFAQGHARFFDPGGGPYDEPDIHADPAFLALHDYSPFARLLTPKP